MNTSGWVLKGVEGRDLVLPSATAAVHDILDPSALSLPLRLFAPQLEKAPLFLPSRYVASGAPSELPVMRIPMEYNMNSVYWYPHFSWDFYRRVRAKRE